MSSHYAASGALAEATPLASHADTGWSDQDITIVTDYLTSLPTVTFASVLHVGGHPDNISFVDRQGWGVPVTRTPDLYAQCYDQRHAIWSAITRRHAQPLQFIDSNTITHQPADTAELYRIAETVGLVTEEIMWVLHHPQSLPYAVTSHTVATSATKIDPNVTIKREPWFVPTERFLVHDHHASVNSAGVNDILAQLLHIRSGQRCEVALEWVDGGARSATFGTS